MADNRRYYWLKLKEDFFTDKRIKRLRRISGGDTYTIIYLKLLLLSLKDSGKLYYDGVETDFIKELALTIDETEDDVMVTVNYLMAQGLMEIITENDEYFFNGNTKPYRFGNSFYKAFKEIKRTKSVAMQHWCNTYATKLQRRYRDRERDRYRVRERGGDRKNIPLLCISKTTRWTRGSVKALPMSRN